MALNAREAELYQKWVLSESRFSNVVGCIGGTRVPIQAPVDDEGTCKMRNEIETKRNETK